MSNVPKVSLQTTIYSLAERGWSQRRIASELGINRETVRRYLRLANPAISIAGSEEGSGSKTSHRERSRVRAAKWPAILRLRSRPRTSSGCISKRPWMPLSSALTRRAPSKLLIVWIRYCPFLLAAPSPRIFHVPENSLDTAFNVRQGFPGY